MKIFTLLFVLSIFSCNKENITPYKHWDEVTVYSSIYGEEKFDTNDKFVKGELIIYNNYRAIIIDVKPLN